MNTPFEKSRIGLLRDEAQRRLEEAENKFRKTYSTVNLDNPDSALEYNTSNLRKQQQEQQRLQKLAAGEKLAPETMKKLADLPSTISSLQQRVQELNSIIEVRRYRDRLGHLERGFDSLGRVYVGYRIYLPVGEDAGESILLVDGVEDPSGVTPVGDGKDLTAPAPAEPAKGIPAPVLGDGGGKPSFREPNATNASTSPPGTP